MTLDEFFALPEFAELEADDNISASIADSPIFTGLWRGRATLLERSAGVSPECGDHNCGILGYRDASFGKTRLIIRVSDIAKLKQVKEVSDD